jgi:mannose-6-phosphate isomerase-like protein (cupin superfamily)
MEFETKMLSEKVDKIAPDGSEIRFLSELKGMGMCHCTLPPNCTSKAVKHKTVEEIWYFIEGRGQVWRKNGAEGEVTPVMPGISLTIPLGTHFQFRNEGNEPLSFIILTIPPWPGEGEAARVADYWEVE